MGNTRWSLGAADNKGASRGFGELSSLDHVLNLLDEVFVALSGVLEFPGELVPLPLDGRDVLLLQVEVFDGLLGHIVVAS